ncbi:MAG: class I SAM-dependent methyltransferase [Steroidobacteraceae bacterium]
MTEGKADHWQTVYQSKQATQVSWFAPNLNISISLLEQFGLNPDSRVIDIGAGASTLVDDLLEMGIHKVTLLDISAASLEVTQQRLGARAGEVQWVVSDAAHVNLPAQSFDFWHDRAAFHFLTDAGDVAAYVAAATRSIVEDGFAIISGFAADGPERCSGLPVVRREPQEVADLFGSAFTLVHSQHERHTTPSGASQAFAYAVLRKNFAT